MIPYNTTDFAFTLDETMFLNISTLNDDTFFTLQIIIKYYDFYSDIEQTKELNYKLPLFNKKCEYNIGDKIHRNLSSISSLNSQFLQYKTALVTVTLNEFYYSDEETAIATETVTDIKFIAGPKPELFENNIALLTVNNNASTISPVGYAVASFLLPSGNYTIEILKNEVVVDSENVVATATDNVFTFNFKAWYFGAVAGDTFQLKVSGTNIFKTFEVGDNQANSNIILFLNEFKLLESLECTGSFSFPAEYSQITHSYKRNNIEVLEIVKTTKENSLTINTGWILETDFITIDSLLDSKKAWLLKRATEVAELAPISKKMVLVNNDNESYQYDLDFKINSTYNAQNYTSQI